MSAGITSQYGFLYQRYIFIKTVLDNVGMDKYFTYEGIDDVDISEIEGINSVSISTDTFIQVKSGTVSRDCWAKVLGNWLLIDHDNPAYIVFCENKLAFTINDEDVISGVCKYFAEGKTKKSTSIANRVYKKFVQDGVDEETTFKKLITSILPKITCEVLPFDTLLEDIEESFKSVYCSDITIYEAAKNCRCNRFIEYVHSEIDSAFGKKKSYTLRYQDFIRIIGKVNAEISDQKYIINISEMKKRKKTMAEALLNNDEHREIRQLRLVDSDSGFIVNELVKELLYKDFRDVYSISKDSLISNIEETAFSNYEDTVYKLSEHADARQLFWETVDKDIPLSIVGNSPIYRHGCYVYLTSDETDEERQITWGKKDE